MRVPVIAVLPAQKPLRDSALAAVQGRSPAVVSAATAPRQLAIDAGFAAVPLGAGRVEERVSLEALLPDASEKFAVRGFVDAATVGEIPHAVDGHPIFADPHIAPLVTCGGTGPVGSDANVATKLNVAALAAKNLNGAGVAIAIMDTGINLQHLTNKLGFSPGLNVGNSWTPPGTSIAPGQHPVNHGTMCAFDVLIAAPKATLLDFPILASTAPGGTFVGQSLSVALLGFAQLIAFWGVAFAPGGAPQYKALVSSNSWGVFHPSWDFPKGHPGRYIDNPNHPFNILVTTLVRSGADVIFAAGNCGAQCADMRCRSRTTETIMGASTLPDVLTLAGCDTNDQRVGYSSQGPSISGMYQQKPDITSYTHFLGSEAFGTGSPDSGTSAACPVAAGCVAALRSSPKSGPGTVTPVQMIGTLQQTARNVPGQTGWNGDYGFGIIDPVAAAPKLGL
jgi:hypothetical protein